MQDFSKLLFPIMSMLLIGGSAMGQDHVLDDEAAVDAETIHSEPAAPLQRVYQATRPCIGAGYVPYAYPAVGSCPCGDDACFDPHRYYCCGKQYKRAWFHKWVGSHLGKRSMLDDYPCACIYPTAVPRPYLREVKPVVDQFPSAPPSAPADTESLE